MNNVKQLPVWKGTWALIRYRPGFFWLSVLAAVYAFGLLQVDIPIEISN